VHNHKSTVCYVPFIALVFARLVCHNIWALSMIRFNYLFLDDPYIFYVDLVPGLVLHWVDTASVFKGIFSILQCVIVYTQLVL
jgi:hypothetical protein